MNALPLSSMMIFLLVAIGLLPLVGGILHVIEGINAETVSGAIFLLVSVVIGPMLILSGFQLMAGQKVKLPSVVKPLQRLLALALTGLAEVAEMVADTVARKIPDKNSKFRPFARQAVKYTLIVGAVALILRALLNFAGPARI